MKHVSTKNLWRMVTDEVSTDEKKIFSSHIEKCPSCKVAYESRQRFHKQLANIQVFEPSHLFIEKVVEKIEESGGKVAPFPFQKTLKVLVLIYALVFAGLFYSFLVNTPSIRISAPSINPMILVSICALMLLILIDQKWLHSKKDFSQNHGDTSFFSQK